MWAVVIHPGHCPVCGYRNQGYRMGTATPTMRTLRMARTICCFPYVCDECRHPLHPDLFSGPAAHLDADTTARVDAWRTRQRQRQRQRRAARAAARPAGGAP